MKLLRRATQRAFTRLDIDTVFVFHQARDFGFLQIVEGYAYRGSRSRWLEGAAAPGVVVCAVVLDLQSRKSNLPA